MEVRPRYRNNYSQEHSAFTRFSASSERAHGLRHGYARTVETARETIVRLSRVIPDFPKPGVSFRDLTPVFADGPALGRVVDALLEPHAGAFDAIAGVEARGFVLAAAAAVRSGCGVVLIRKPGKLPRPVLSADYDLEYGSTTLQVQPDEVAAGTRVLLVDDVLATGGTLAAARDLIDRAGWSLAGIGVVLELAELGGRARLEGSDIHAMLTV